MMGETAETRVLLTASDVQKLEDEYARMNAEIADIEAKRRDMERRRDEITGRLAKISELMKALGIADRLVDSTHGESKEDLFDGAKLPGKPSPVIAERATEEGRRSPWPAEIIKHLRAGPYESSSSFELRKAIENGPLGNVLKVSDKGYYHAIRRLAKNGEITKAHNRLFTPSGLRDFEADLAAGKTTVIVPRSVSVRGSPMADAIVEFISQRNEGVRAKEIIGFLVKDSRFVSPVTRNHSSAYNVLVRLISRGQLTRDMNGLYRLPDKTEAPTTNYGGSL